MSRFDITKPVRQLGWGQAIAPETFRRLSLRLFTAGLVIFTLAAFVGLLVMYGLQLVVDGHWASTVGVSLQLAVYAIFVYFVVKLQASRLRDFGLKTWQIAILLAVFWFISYIPAEVYGYIQSRLVAVASLLSILMVPALMAVLYFVAPKKPGVRAEVFPEEPGRTEKAFLFLQETLIWIIIFYTPTAILAVGAVQLLHKM